MKKQTAVEYLFNKLRELAHNDNHHFGLGDIRITQGMLDELEEPLKEIEKHHLYQFYIQGGIDASTGADRNVEDYYNKTFKSE